MVALHPPPLPNAPGQPISGWMWDDYRELPDDGRRYELLEGELYMAPRPTSDHQDLTLALAANLRAALAGRAKVLVAPFDMRLDEATVAQPDVLVLLDTHRERLRPTHLDGPADLVIEVLSHHRTRDEVRKRRIHAAAGIGEYRLADPATRSITCLRHDGHGYPDAPVLTSEAIVPSAVAPARSVADWLR